MTRQDMARPNFNPTEWWWVRYNRAGVVHYCGPFFSVDEARHYITNPPPPPAVKTSIVKTDKPVRPTE